MARARKGQDPVQAAAQIAYRKAQERAQDPGSGKDPVQGPVPDLDKPGRDLEGTGDMAGVMIERMSGPEPCPVGYATSVMDHGKPTDTIKRTQANPFRGMEGEQAIAHVVGEVLDVIENMGPHLDLSHPVLSRQAVIREVDPGGALSEYLDTVMEIGKDERDQINERRNAVWSAYRDMGRAFKILIQAMVSSGFRVNVKDMRDAMIACAFCMCMDEDGVFDDEKYAAMRETLKTVGIPEQETTWAKAERIVSTGVDMHSAILPHESVPVPAKEPA